MTRDDKTELRRTSEADRTRLVASRSESGVVIPGVEVGAKLGEGGMAAVFEGLDRGFNPARRVAVKLMAESLSGDPAFRDRFEQEASIVADFRHDNIVRVYSSGEADGLKFIVMEYLSGGTLADRLDQGALPAAHAIRIASRLSDALAYSHSKGIVHRDFKPGNVLFTDDDKPVLSDFGVARSTSGAAAGLTQFASIIGAPRYMAPEQERGDTATDRADVYSLGLTLFEMLTGKLPPPRQRVLRPDEIQTLATLIPDAPPAVRSLIARCLQLDPSARPTADDCHRTLSAITGSTTFATSSARNVDRRDITTRWWILGGLALALVTATAYWWFAGAEPEPAATSTAPVAEPPPTVGGGVGDGRSTIDTAGKLSLRRAPKSARIFANNREVIGSTVELPAGTYAFIAVAPGHYGELRSVDVSARSERDLSFQLRPTQLPLAREYELFLKLADASSVTNADIGAIREPTLQTAIRIKLLRQDGQREELDRLTASLESLSDAGDLRAPTARFLASVIEAGHFSNELVTDEMLAASANGDAMASLFIAAALRDELQGSGTRINPASRAYRQYCEQLSRAKRQGWVDVATSHARRDHCSA